MVAQLTLPLITSVNGVVDLPGSKSISNRALLLSALAEGQTTLVNLLNSDDVHHMLNALMQLGVSIQLSDDRTQAVVTGIGGPFQPDTSPLSLFSGNAGTVMRPLCAAIALCQQGEFELTGGPRMEERPIGILVNALRQAGAHIDYLRSFGCPPLKIRGHGGLAGGLVQIDGSVSSQFLTALLMVALFARNTLTVEIVGDLVSKPYVDMTLKMMACFGATVDNQNYQRFVVPVGQRYLSPGKFTVESDASSASYFLAAGAMAGDVTVIGIGCQSIQGDVAFAKVLKKMGALIELEDDYIRARHVRPLQAVDLDLNEIPDSAMTLAIVALVARGVTAIRNVHNWRFKETDRLTAMAHELKKVGATVEEGNNYLTIAVPSFSSLRHAEIDTYDDHRMAMCFSLVALAKIPVTINNPGCTSKTFPSYFKQFLSLKQ